MDADASQRKHVRGKNWSIVEDETLCEAWLDVSQDPIVSMDQKVDMFYDRVMESFTSISKEKSLPIDSDSRTPSSLKARWGTIQRSVNKFCGFYAQARQRKRSGTNISDQLNEALVLYKSDQKLHFQFMHAFKILENAPKWKATMCLKENRAPKRKVLDLEMSESAVTQGGSDESTPSESSSSQISTNAEPPVSSVQIRPAGRKAAKVDDAILKNSSSLADSGRSLAETAKFKMKDTEKRTKALVRMANHAIMSVNPQSLPPTSREYYELEQARILNEVKDSTSDRH